MAVCEMLPGARQKPAAQVRHDDAAVNVAPPPA